MSDWKWVAASRRGTAHRDVGERRLDAFRTAVVGDGGDFFVAVACDGAGSASHGREGASIAVWTLAEAARWWLTGTSSLPDAAQVETWMALARLRILVHAAKRDLELRDFATTVVMAISDGSSTITAHIGDGVIVARDPSSSDWTALSWPEQGEYASTTYFLTDEPEVRLRVACHDGPIDRLAVMTDGLERLALDMTTNTPHAPFFDALAAPVAAAPSLGRNCALSAQLGAFLDGEQVNARTDDDKTLILAAWM